MEFGPLHQRILQLAVSGQLVEQLDSEPAVEQVGPAPKPDEVPFELPPKWKWVQAGYLGNWKSGQTPSRTNQSFWNQGTVPWLKSGEITDGLISEIGEKVTELAVNECNLRLNSPGSVVVAIYGATAGKVGIIQDFCVTNQACCVCKVNSEQAINWYLLYSLLAIREMLLSKTAGSAQPNLSKEKVIATWIPVPPIEEQHRIVAKVDALLGRLEKMEAAYSEFAGPMTEHFRNLMLDKAIKGLLVPQLDSEPEVEQVGPAPKPEEVPFELPPKWKWVQLTNLSSKSFSGGTPSKANPEYWGGDIPWASIKDLSPASEELLTTQDYITELGLQESSSKLVETGNVIVGMRMGLDKIAINRIRVAINQDLRGLYLDPELIIPEYFVKFYKTLKLEGAGTTVKGIKANQLLATWIPLPPLGEQRRIVAKIEEVFAGVEKLGSLMEYA